MINTFTIILIAYYLIINVVTYIAMYLDKKKAIKGAYRTPEKTLFTMSLIGGFVGNYLAMQTFRHKTKHTSFYIVNAVALVIHIVILYFYFF